MTNRRDFILFAGSVLGFTVWRGPRTMWQLLMPEAQAQTSGPAEFRDLYVRSIGFQGVLTASQWQAGRSVTLSQTIEPGSHNHRVTISAATIARLSSGQDVTFGSEQAQGHQHDVTIRLRDTVPGGNVIPNLPKVPDLPSYEPPYQPPYQPPPYEPPYRPNYQSPSSSHTSQGTPPTSAPSLTSDGTFAALLGEGAEPYLYVEALQQVDGASLFYCIGDERSCARMDWAPMQPEPSISGRRIFRSRSALRLAPNDIIHVSARDMSGKTREFHARITPASNGLFLQKR